MKAWKSLFLVAALAAAIAVVLFALSCKKDEGEEETPLPTWTVMMYGDGNNNLDTLNNSTSYIIQDAQDMEKVGSQSGLNIIAMISSIRTGGQAKYHKIGLFPNENPGQISSEVLMNMGGRDMSDPATLRAFIDYCKANYPADHYLLVVDDHGAGWPGSCNDDLNGGGGLLTMPELKTAIATSQLQRVDIVTFHACLMAMAEVCYELKTVASYVTASQFSMPMQNILGADIWLEWIKNNRAASPSAVAHKVVESVRDRAVFKQKTTHYAMIDLTQMDNLGSKLGNFGTILVTEAAQYWDEVVNAWNQTHSTSLDNPAYCDIREFVNKALEQTHLAQSNLIRTAGEDVRNAINVAVPYTETHFYTPDQPVPRGGLNVHFPFRLDQFDSTNYVTLGFRGTNWHSFLSTWLRRAGQQDPTGRCCYNNNANCQETTQAGCVQLNGTWVQGIDCNTPCQQGGGCPTACDQATAITLGQAVTSCQLQTSEWNFFTVYVEAPHTYRFQLDNFAGGADFDLYTYLLCADWPNTPFGCSSDQVGPEDFNCQINQGQGNLIIGVRAFQGSGGYRLLVTQVALASSGERPRLFGALAD